MQSPFAILDFPSRGGQPGRSLLFERPLKVLRADTLDAAVSVLRDAEAAAKRGQHVVGYIAYEAAPAFDPALAVRPRASLPLAWFAVFENPVPADESAPGSASARWTERTARASYDAAVQSIREAIGRGDVYQVNHTVRLDVSVDGDPAALYRRLLAAQGPGYGARLHTGVHEILSASPELFFTRTGNRITTRPMKGTARRGRWLAEDDEHVATLAASEKERAENVMIVDLIRNDLGRVARTGTVEVTKLFDVERRPTVLQMTSTIEATLQDDVTLPDLFASLFPCGSVTGAPKIAATKQIALLEDSPRGVYCGAIGYIEPGGDCTFSVAIRTLTIDHTANRAEYGVGSGITWDSAQAAEYDEVIAKAAILTHDLPMFELLETIRFERGSYTRIDRHLARLSASARYFGFDGAAMVDAARVALESHARSATTPERVRLTVAPSGVAQVSSSPLPALHAAATVALASSPVRRANRFLYHKTTHRSVYDRHRSEHPGAFDVLLWNEDGELTEFTIGNVVLELDGVRVTPPRSCGLLAGVFRDELLARGEIRERVITPADLARATRVWLINSVREWVDVAVADAGLLEPAVVDQSHAANSHGD